MRTNENGITLLSLVITVVVLGILASVLVDLSLRDNDAVNVVKKAKKSIMSKKNKLKIEF